MLIMSGGFRNQINKKNVAAFYKMFTNLDNSFDNF